MKHHVFFTGAAAILTGVSAAALAVFGNVRPAYAYLGGINIGLFALCAFDKSSAAAAANRVPERVLYLFAALGGTLGLLLGMNIFRHKTQKSGFQLVLFMLLIAQVLLVRFALGR